MSETIDFKNISNNVQYDNEMRELGFYRLEVVYEEDNDDSDDFKKEQLVKLAQLSFEWEAKILAIKVDKKVGVIIFKEVSNIQFKEEYQTECTCGAEGRAGSYTEHASLVYTRASVIEMYITDGLGCDFMFDLCENCDGVIGMMG